MQKGKFNIVTDGQWGSCGKGMVTSALVNRFLPDVISTTNMANAGHTAVNHDGKKFIAKALPSGAIMRVWKDSYKPRIVVGSSAGFHLVRMLQEAEECGCIDNRDLVIHSRAGVITESHRRAEGTSTIHVASTMQGCAEMLSDKIMRRADMKLARDYPELRKFMIMNPNHENEGFAVMHDILTEGGTTTLHEGSQGFSLDINHGSHYPHCTSRGTTALQNMADMGISPRKVGDIYLVIRPYPIRVGNVYDSEGNKLGDSGGCYGDQREITWEEVAKISGMPQEEADKLKERELTTVTGRLRRVFTFSSTQLRLAAKLNGATKLALNFANYIDWNALGCKKWQSLPDKVKDFAAWCEYVCGIPVAMVGTGPRCDDVCWRSARSLSKFPQADFELDSE